MSNPFKRQPGYGLRVNYARKALVNLARGCDMDRDGNSRVHGRAMDNCFENYDGSAVVWALMHEAAQEPDVYGQSLLTQGIKLFTGNEHCLKHWQDVYAHKAGKVQA